jgi:hypothetical protein
MAVLSKIKLGNTVYDLKDAKSRQDLETLLGSHALEALGTAAWADVASTGVSDNNGTLPTAAQVKSYVDSAVAAIPEFDVVVVNELPTASADTFHKIYLLNATSPAAPNLYKEYITIRSGSEEPYTYTWELIGDTSMDLSTYLQNTATVAGVAFGEDKAISAAELEAADALNLKALSHKDSASTELTDYATGITGAAYTPAGNVTLNALTQTATEASLTTADYTPAGSITGSAISDGSISVTLKDAATASSATLTTSSYTPAGEVSKPSITVTPTDDSIQPVSNVGTAASLSEGFFTAGSAASFTEGAFTPASLTHAESAFAVEGIVAAIDSTDTEQLNLTNATTANASLISAFSGGSKAADSFTANTPAAVDVTKFDGGSVPTLGTAKTFLTGASAALDTAPTFTGTAEADLKVTKVEYMKQAVDEASFTGTAATLGFSGTTVTDALVTGVSYDKATANGASFSGTAATITPTLDKGTKTITVE